MQQRSGLSVWPVTSELHSPSHCPPPPEDLSKEGVLTLHQAWECAGTL